MPFVSFAEVKARVSILQVVTRYGVSPRRVNHSAMRCDCPLPQHGAGSKQSFAISLEKNVWSCQSKGCCETRGKKGGNVLDFVSSMEGCSVRDAAVKLSEWFLVSPAAAEVPAAASPPNPVLGFELQGIQHEHAYLLGRGFEEEECEYLGVGFFPGKGSMMGRVVFPIHNERGELVAYCGRSTDNSDPRWKQPAGFQKNLVVYNLHRVEGDSVILCESFWGVLACVRAGIMNAVSVMGHFISPEQAALLSRFRHLTVLYDGDEAGEEGIAQALQVFPAAEIIRLPRGRQPDHFSVDALRSVLRQPEEFGDYTLVA